MIIEGYLRSYTPAGKILDMFLVTVRNGIVEMFGSKRKDERRK